MEVGPVGARMVVVVLLVAKDRDTEHDHAHLPNHLELVPIATEAHS